MEVAFVSPSRLLLTLREQSSGEFRWGNIQMLARMYVNYKPPTSRMLDSRPTWPSTALFAGYVGFRRYFDAYIGKLKHFAECKSDVRAIAELVRLYASQHDWDEEYWTDRIVTGACFDSPKDRRSEIEIWSARLDEIASKDKNVNSVREELEQWKEDLISAQEGVFSGPPTYDLESCDEEKHWSMWERFSYGYDYYDCGDNDSTVSDLSMKDRLVKYSKVRPDLALRMLRSGMNGASWFWDDCASRSVVDVLTCHYSCNLDWQKYKSYADKVDKLVECIRDEKQVPYADREFDALMGVVDLKDSQNCIELIEDKALIGSPKACLYLHDYCVKRDDELRVLADFWWKLRDKFLTEPWG